MNDHYHYMREALKQAELAFCADEVPVGAVLVESTGRILAKEHNKPISLKDPTAHAEILVLRKGAKLLNNYRLTGTTLYVTIEPCVMCAGALVHARVKRVVFGATDLKSGACGSVFNIINDKRLNHRIEIVKGIMEPECRAIIQDFFRQRRKLGGEVPKRS